MWSLGVLLYELLAGRVPHPAAGRPIDEALMELRCSEPTRLGRLDPALKGDLEILAGKALEKEPERRYATAADLAADVRRYLAREPIAAHPPSAVYRVRRFARRHRALVAGLAATLLACLAGTGASLWQASRARASALEAAAETRRARAAEQRLLEESERARVAEVLQRQQAARALAMRRLLLDTLQLGEPERLGGQASFRDVLLSVSGELQEGGGGSEADQALLHHVMASTLEALGEYSEAHRHALRAVELGRSAYGEDGPRTLEFRRMLGTTLYALDDLEEAEEVCRLAFESSSRELGTDSRRTWLDAHDLALVLQRLGSWGEAHFLLEEALDNLVRLFGERDRDALTTLNSLGVLHELLEDHAAAESSYTRCLRLREEVLGEAHPETLGTRNNLAVLREAQGRLDEACALFRQVAEQRATVLGETHPLTLLTRANLAAALARGGGEPDEAERELRAVVRSQAAVLDPDHRELLISRANLAIFLYRAGRHGEARREQEEVVRGAFARVRGTDPLAGIWLTDLAAMCLRTDAPADAADCIRRAEPILGRDHPQLRGALADMVRSLEAHGSPAAAAWRRAAADPDAPLPDGGAD